MMPGSRWQPVASRLSAVGGMMSSSPIAAIMPLRIASDAATPPSGDTIVPLRITKSTVLAMLMPYLFVRLKGLSAEDAEDARRTQRKGIARVARFESPAPSAKPLRSPR